MAFLAFKSQILENYVVNSILPSLQFWFCLSKWLHLENNFWVPNYATGLRSAILPAKFCARNSVLVYLTSFCPRGWSQQNFLEHTSGQSKFKQPKRKRNEVFQSKQKEKSKHSEIKKLKPRNLDIDRGYLRNFPKTFNVPRFCRLDFQYWKRIWKS